MTTREIDSNISIAEVFTPAPVLTNNTTVAGTAVDLQGYYAAEAVVHVGTYAETIAGSFSEFSLQESADSATGWTDVANADLTDTVAASSTITGGSTTGVFGKVSSTGTDNVILKTGYKGSKRWIRVKENAQTNHNVGLPFGAVIIRAKGATNPVG